MECPLCFELYSDSEEMTLPMRLACCQLTMCRGCLRRTMATTSRCPWEKTRWISRSFYKKCEDVTPPNLLHELRQVYEGNSNTACPVQPSRSSLGDGELSKEYARMIESRQKRSAELNADCIEKDSRYAAELLQAEQLEDERRWKEQKEIARRDAEYALRWSNSDSPKAELKTNNKITIGKMLSQRNINTCKNDQTSGSIAAWLSRKKPKQTHEVLSLKVENGIVENIQETNEEIHPQIVHDGRKEVICLDCEVLPTTGNAEMNGTRAHVNFEPHSFPTSKVPNIIEGLNSVIKPIKSYPNYVVASSSGINRSAGWFCEWCTFENYFELFECEVCDAKRPPLSLHKYPSDDAIKLSSSSCTSSSS